MPATLPEVFGRYQIVKKLGQGGMGAVYLAEDTVMRRKVALKVPDFDGRKSQSVLERFHREARVAAEIRHPGVCPVYDVGEVNGVHFLTMAYIEGNTLHDLIDSGRPWPAAKAVEMVRHIAEALVALHQAGIVHRDLKPANIMVEKDGSPVLLDFGLARSVTAASQQVTAAGATLGTPAYMAPEQVSGKLEATGPHTDVYALGTILFELLTGRLPFQAGTLAELYGAILYSDRPAPSTFAPVEPTLDRLCLEALAIDPARRPRTMPELIARLPQAQGDAGKSASVSTRCPGCHKRIRLPEKTTGKKLRCPNCNFQLTGPAAPPPEVFTVPDGVSDPRRRTASHAHGATLTAVPPPTPHRVSSTRPGPAGVSKGALVALAAVGAGLLGVAVLVVLILVGGSSTQSSPAADTRAAPPTTSAKPTTPVTPVASLKLILPAEASVTAGESATIVVEIKRENLRGEVKLLPGAQGEGVTLRLSPIAEDRSSVGVQVEADPKAKPGVRTVGIVVRGPGSVETQGTITVEVKQASTAVALVLKSYPEVGKKLVITEKQTTTTVLTVEGSAPQTTKVVEEYEYEFRVVRGSDKKPEKVTRAFTKATRTQDGTTTRLPYHGRTIVYTLDGDEYRVTAEGAPALAAEEAKNLGRSANESDILDSLLDPGRPLQVGESWSPGKWKIAAMYTSDELVPDLDTSKVTGKLLRVYTRDKQRWGAIELTMNVTMKPTAALAKTWQFSETPVSRSTLTYDTPIDASSASTHSVQTSRMTLKGTVTENGTKSKCTYLVTTDSEINAVEK